jgi:hypothetical protein
MHHGCAVSGVALLAVLLASARRVAGYDPSDVLAIAEEVPAGEGAAWQGQGRGRGWAARGVSSGHMRLVPSTLRRPWRRVGARQAPSNAQGRLFSPPAPPRPRLPGAVDQLLDEVYSNDLPEPEWDGLDGGDSDDEGEGEGPGSGGGSDDEGGRPEEEAAKAAASSSVGGGAVASPRAAARRATRARGPARPRGVTSLFTWAGSGCCLGPLGLALPELRTLNVALPPSLAGLVMQEPGAVDELPEVVLSLGDALPHEEGGAPGLGPAGGGSGRGTANPLRRFSWAAGGGGAAAAERSPPGRRGLARHSAAPGVAGASTAAAVAPPTPPLRRPPPPSAFKRLRTLSISNLTSGASQWDPSARLGDGVLRAVAEGAPALETLQVRAVGGPRGGAAYLSCRHVPLRGVAAAANPAAAHPLRPLSHTCRPQLDGVLCFTGAGLSALSALTQLKELALHHWMSERAAAAGGLRGRCRGRPLAVPFIDQQQAPLPEAAVPRLAADP